MQTSTRTPNSTAVTSASTMPAPSHTAQETAFTLSLLNLGAQLNSFGQSAPAATEIQPAGQEEYAIVRR